MRHQVSCRFKFCTAPADGSVNMHLKVSWRYTLKTWIQLMHFFSPHLFYCWQILIRHQFFHMLDSIYVLLFILLQLHSYASPTPLHTLQVYVQSSWHVYCFNFNCAIISALFIFLLNPMPPVCMIMVLWHKPWSILVKTNSVVLNFLDNF